MFRIRNYKSYDEETGEPLYWSNEDGWVDSSSATWFTEEEMRRFGLPAEGIWEQNSATMVFTTTHPVIVEIFDSEDDYLEKLEELWAETTPWDYSRRTEENTVRMFMRRFGINHYRIIRYNQIGE